MIPIHLPQLKLIIILEPNPNILPIPINATDKQIPIINNSQPINGIPIKIRIDNNTTR